MTPLIFLILLLPNIVTVSSVVQDETRLSTCNSCCQGPAGLPGVPGSAGIPGSNGASGRDGFRGEVGANGAVGETGAVGARGTPGPQGHSGGRGERGDTGLQGLQGKVGPRGMEGRSGTDGQPGVDGQRGLMGPKGSVGEAYQVQQSAFTVLKTSLQSGSSDDVLTFNIAQTNLGFHYSMSTHKFTCQIPGTYVFMFTISSDGYTYDPHISLVKDGDRIIAAHIRDNQASVNNFQQSSNTAILQLAVGNQVWLKFGGGTVDGGKYSTFSGFLLYSE